MEFLRKVKGFSESLMDSKGFSGILATTYYYYCYCYCYHCYHCYYCLLLPTTTTYNCCYYYYYNITPLTG